MRIKINVSAVVCCILSLSLFHIKSFAQEKTGANTENVSAGSNDTLSVWAVPAEQKVRPTDKIETSNLVWSKTNRKINVAGAGNEHVPFQVVITNPIPPGRRPKAPGGFFITGSALTSKNGKTIPQSQVNFYLEHYIMLYAKSGPVGAEGAWPDALAPVKEPFNMASQYSVVKNRPVWVDVKIPAQTPAGIYSGTITVTRDGKKVETLNIDIRVYGFSIPEKTSFVTYMNISKNWMSGFYHKESSSPEMDKLTQTYYDFLYEHRMEPWFNDQLSPQVTLNGDKVEVKFDDSRYDYYLNKLKSNRVLLEAIPNDLSRQMKDKKFSKAFNDKVKSYLSQLKAYFDKNGWKHALVINSPIDEPNTKEDYDETREWAKLVHEAAPGVPFLATESPVTDDPEWGNLTGHVNNFSIHGNALNESEVKKAIKTEQSKGGEMTWYISCDQMYPQPNYFIDAPAMDPVMVPWITESYKMTGILYWAANFWTETPNPWLDAVTFISGYLCSDGYVLNGEGSFLYPGDYVKRYTNQPDVNGPVSSIRFELLREGIEDYDYIQMLKNAGDTAFADDIVSKMVIDVSTFSRNVEDLYAARKAMAERLEKRK
ncbi:MAG TPA: glycoside hydrolase domain-containing protein [Flavitalea sp.]|nr:glycoside hydrolase domain-containing protein [Flavitalea sp.]